MLVRLLTIPIKNITMNARTGSTPFKRPLIWRSLNSVVVLSLLISKVAWAQVAPLPDEQQLPDRMHAAMSELPSIRVGQTNANFIGKDNRVLQAAVDYIAGLGGGTVEIGEGVYEMRDSLHLRSNVRVVGVPGKTVLRKAKGYRSALALDGDFGEEQITLVDPAGFSVGYGVAVTDKRSGGFHTTVGRITGRRGNTFSISHPLMADCMVGQDAYAATIFPVVSIVHCSGVEIEGLVIDGNKEENLHLNGCRGAGIYMYRGHGTVLKHCLVRDYSGDGISFQQSNDVTVMHCQSEGNTHLGLHPGSGSQRPIITNNIAKNNGEDGLFLCWRVRHGLFENNILENNGRFGISIGHKDSDNLLRGNHVFSNEEAGVYFRNETYGMAGHRNRLEDNLIENNGVKSPAPGIRIRGETDGLVFRNNTIRETRQGGDALQTTGIQIEESAGRVELEGNTIQAKQAIVDQRQR